ncbi:MULTISPECIES: hypothetical protein [unclassified Sphingomonas]|uniref:hypothetical protein n=1 Tax=unclassified Sphingomonas TaxID=196159 RepID=UPI000B0ABD61|nr:MULTISPECIES: hypothetical protein [unclassified Sphingomonas]
MPSALTPGMYQPPVMGRSAGEILLSGITRWLIFATLAICVVVPHSFQEATAALLLLTAIASLLIVRKAAYLDTMLMLYFCGVVVTAFYIWIGYSSGAPREAVNQTLIVYILAPLIWLLIGTAMFQQMGTTRPVRLLVLLTWVAVLSVAAFFYAFLTFGKESVQFLSEDVNVNVARGYSGANILVYGSLIFLSGAFFAQPTLVRNRFLRMLLPLALVVCALTSGRSALILAVPVGFVTGVVLRARVGLTDEDGNSESVFWPTVLLGVLSLLAVVLIDVALDTVDLQVVIGEFIDELQSGGGALRTEQVVALWDGVEESWGLGVGHGIGVRYLRSDLFPWRYEVIPLASLLRVGFIGTLVYASVFVVYGALLFRRVAEKLLRPEDIYMAGGFTASAMAMFTNPYIESFIFQWMYFLPVLSLGIRRNVDPGGAAAANVATA